MMTVDRDNNKHTIVPKFNETTEQNRLHPLRQFYRSYLARHRVFRALKNIAIHLFWGVYTPTRWRVAKFIRANTPKRGHVAIPMNLAPTSSRVLIEAEHWYDVPSPNFVGKTPTDQKHGATTPVKSPKLEIAEIIDASIIGGTDLIFKDRTVIHPDLYNPATEVCPAETFGLIKVHGKTIRAVNRPKRRVHQAVSLISQCEGNYAHFLVEVLPRLTVLNQSNLFDDAPILMAKWTHPNFHRALHAVNQGRREIILVDRWESIFVDHLITVSPTAYIVAEHRDHYKTRSLVASSRERFPFSRSALLSTKAAILSNYPNLQPSRGIAAASTTCAEP